MLLTTWCNDNATKPSEASEMMERVPDFIHQMVSSPSSTTHRTMDTCRSIPRLEKEPVAMAADISVSQRKYSK